MTARHEYHSNFADARRHWQAAAPAPLAAPSWRPGPFDRFEWFEALDGAVLADRSPLIAQAHGHGSDHWLFLVQDGPHVAALANYYSFSWRPVHRGAPSPLALDEIARGLRARAATLDLGPVPHADAPALADALRRAGWVVAAEETGMSHWLDTQGRSFAAWWAQRPGALRSTVQRKARKQRVVTAIHTAFDDALWDEYERVYAASWKTAESHPAFLRDWARRASSEGALRLGLAHIDGVAAAAQFWIVDEGTAYIVKLAHAAGHDALSPGTLLTHALFEHAFDVDRVARIDFGTGDDGYKRDWMEHSAPLVTLRGWNPARAAAWPGLARHLAKRVATQVGAR